MAEAETEAGRSLSSGQSGLHRRAAYQSELHGETLSRRKKRVEGREEAREEGEERGRNEQMNEDPTGFL